MDQSTPDQIGRVLRALAALSPESTTHTASLSIPIEWFRWVPLAAVSVLANADVPPTMALLGPRTTAAVMLDRAYAERLAAISQVRAASDIRLGWLFLAGRVTDSNGKSHGVFQPLVSVEVKVSRQPIAGPAHVTRIGDVQLSNLIADAPSRHDLESRIEYGGGGFAMSATEASPALLARMPRLRAFAFDAAHAAGFAPADVVAALSGPEELLRHDEIVVVAGVGLYAAEGATEDLSRAGSLRDWAAGDLTAPTALHALYTDVTGRPSADDEVVSAFRLTPTQASAVAASRSAPITVVSGAPGTGKSHTLAAIAQDAIGRGQNVLVVAKTDATVDALIDLLEQAQGPNPIVFGSNERRDALAERLGSGALRPVDDVLVVRAADEAARTRRKARDLREEMAAKLAAEAGIALGASAAGDEVTLEGAAAQATELRRLREVLAARGLWSGYRRRRARAALRAQLGLAGDVSLGELHAAVTQALARLDGRRLLADGGLTLVEEWKDLAFREARAREAHGEWLSRECEGAHRLDSGALRAVSALAIALRSGRGARREQLRRLRHSDTTRALPLWIGTLADVDDLLPPQAGFFDLVILDEAASIDQPLAAPALLRGKRAVIAGDPRQLRQTSFLSDAKLAAALDDAGLRSDAVLCARLDVRRNSVLDLATGCAPPILLDEHFRCDPHLIEFVARRFYGGRITIASRRPSTQERDCIDVVACEGARDKDGVVAAEVEAVLDVIRHRSGGGVTIGVITPFRAQADAIEAAVLAAYSADQLEAMDLRVGTVHGFQGNERDLMIVSLGVGESSSAWRFVENPALAAVMLTRARKHLVVVVAGDPPKGGIISDFLAQADAPPGPPTPAHASSGWVEAIHDGAAFAGVALLASYPTGRHVVDLVLADAEHDVAIECDVHPNGVESHIRRRLEMMDRGWRFEEAYRSAWTGRVAELVVDLLNRLQAAS